MLTGEEEWIGNPQADILLQLQEVLLLGAKQVLWHRSLFQELEIDLPATSTIFSDNQAAIAITHHPEFHARTKHIDITYHFLRDLVKSGTLNLVYIKISRTYLQRDYLGSHINISHSRLVYCLTKRECCDVMVNGQSIT